jgi:hypothetical protein
MLLPTHDGQDITYDWRSSEFAPRSVAAGRDYVLVAPRPGASYEVLRRQPRMGRYNVVFVNGIKGNREKFAHQALTVSAVSGGPVTAIYNESHGMALDLLQCVADKRMSPEEMKLGAGLGRLMGIDAVGVMFSALRLENQATANLYLRLVDSASHMTKIVAHSQGCLIAVNAVNALVATNGSAAIKKVRVIALGSPVTFWSDAAPIVKEFRFANDLVGWLSLRRGAIGHYAMGYTPGEARHDPSERVVGYRRGGLPTQLGQMATHSAFIYLQRLFHELQPMFP